MFENVRPQIRLESKRERVDCIEQVIATSLHWCLSLSFPHTLWLHSNWPRPSFLGTSWFPHIPSGCTLADPFLMHSCLPSPFLHASTTPPGHTQRFINPSTPRAFSQKPIFLTFWRFSGWIWTELAPRKQQWDGQYLPLSSHVLWQEILPSFSLKFLRIFVHISGSIELTTLIWVSLEKSFPPAEVDYRWCQFWSKVMTSEQRTKAKACHGRLRPAQESMGEGSDTGQSAWL